MSAMLYVFGGLPASGKTTLSQALSRRVAALHLRIDTIEQAMRRAGMTLHGPEGYEVAYELAQDNLRLGHSVVADSVNPIAITRDAWRAVASRVGVRCREIEVVCSNRSEHRERVETRTSSISDLRLPSWEDVLQREYETWEGALVIDTAGQTSEESISTLFDMLDL